MGQRVPCEILTGQEEGDTGAMVNCVYANCSKCGHETMSFGDSDASVRRCLALLREECPRGESNFYVDEDDE